jgi:hypothetical protein
MWFSYSIAAARLPKKTPSSCGVAGTSALDISFIESPVDDPVHDRTADDTDARNDALSRCHIS